MKTIPRPLMSVLVLGLLAAGLRAKPPAAAGDTLAQRVTVNFVHPEKFTEVKENSTDFENDLGRQNYLPRLREYLEQRAPKYLAAGQKLTVDFTDFDLAGDFEPWHRVQLHEVRIVRDRYPPRATLHFTLTDADGHTVREGDRQLIDGGFMLGSSSLDIDSLRYEKQMLDNWLRAEFPPRKN